MAVELHTAIYGNQNSSQTLVMLHGMGSASTAWKAITPYLRDQFKIVTIDLPGHGETKYFPTQPMDPQSLAALIVETLAKEHEIEEFHLVGNSWGGWICLEIAALFPAQTQSVLALAPAGLWLTPFTTRFPVGGIHKVLAGSLKIVSIPLLKYEWGRKVGFADISPQWQSFSYELCVDATLAMAKSTGYYPAWDAMLKKRFDSKINSDIPVQIIFGDSDRTLPAATCQERTLAPAHAEWVILDGCGHAPMWDRPQTVVSHIRELVKIK